MKTIRVEQPINLKVVKFELDFSTLLPEPEKSDKPCSGKKINVIKVANFKGKRKPSIVPPTPTIENCTIKRKDTKELIEELLDDLYSDQRDWSTSYGLDNRHGSTSGASWASSQSNCGEHTDGSERICLDNLDIYELQIEIFDWQRRLQAAGKRLARCVRLRDKFRRQQRRLCAALTVVLRHITGDANARFGITPGAEAGPGEGGYSEWLHAMRLVARLPAGVPQHFRKKLWLTLSDRHLTARGIDWPVAERACFRGTAQPDDTELGAQILKDLHRTGCSLFCGAEGRENQAMLRRVLLAYARWNKDVGYCQGFNMLAAIILEVMDKSESDSLKVMIYLVEAVLPEGYFADDLRGLSADMAAFRDLLRLRLPRLANHMDHLQRISDGGGVEPPLPDVFTMQWFLTLYATWLQRDCLLRIWDLVLLDGNEVLLLTALAIWDLLQDRILSARSADEFYSCMGGGAGAVWEAGESLVARVVAFGSAPELPRLRHLHRYRVAPPAPPTAPSFQPPLHTAMQTMTKRGLRLFYSEDEGDSSDDGNKMALATVIPRREDRLGAGDRLTLDIGALKRQYARLRERQRQAHVILAAACARHAAVGVPTSPTSLTVNNLLLGKSAIVSSRGRRLGPPPGAVPPSRQTSLTRDKPDISPQEQSHIDTISWNEEKSRKSLTRRNSVKWKDIKKHKHHKDKTRKASIDLDETGDGIIVSEREADEMIASLRSRSSSESSSYSSKTASSTDTSLCDENERESESESEIVEDNNQKISLRTAKKLSPLSIPMETQQGCSPLKEIEVVRSPLDSELVFNPEEKQIECFKNITDYLDTAAGEPLRTYIDGFESKLKESYIANTEETKILVSPCGNKTSHSNYLSLTPNEVLETIPINDSEESKLAEIIRPVQLISVSKNFTELSPIAISPVHIGGHHKSCDYDFKTNVIRPLSYKSVTISRPPDIIDTFVMNPNFVPDIDLSDKNISDIDSPSRSPGADSIVVSEDEPLIPLTIDKYFEHSPEFFGARLTDPNNLDIPNRRATKRLSRIPKKPDSLTLQSSTVDRTSMIGTERSSSLPQSHSFSSKNELFSELEKDIPVVLNLEKLVTIDVNKKLKEHTTPVIVEGSDKNSPKDYIIRFGRKNSERALQIIQENSKILSRILTKQNAAEKSKPQEYKSIENILEEQKSICSPSIASNPLPLDFLNLKESTSDTIIGYGKVSARNDSFSKTEFVKVRPISIDDPFSLEFNTNSTKNVESATKASLLTNLESLENKIGGYGWENKGFLGKCDYKSVSDIPDNSYGCEIKDGTNTVGENDSSLNAKPVISEFSRYPYSDESKTFVTLPSSEPKEISANDCQIYTGDYSYPFSTKYNDFVLSKARDICNKTLEEEQGSRVRDILLKTENSQVTDFSHIVTSSISFSYEPSAEDDFEAKSNSSDTLCQITSLDQVSTPISPKIFPNKETPTLPKDFSDKIENVKVESEDTCSTITSLMETDTISSISYPRSPSTGSYHPFPTRPSLRMPKELGVRLGMYPKDTINSPTK